MSIEAQRAFFRGLTTGVESDDDAFRPKLVMSAAEAAVGACYAWHANKASGLAFPSAKTVSRETRLSTRAVIRARGSLTKLGVLQSVGLASDHFPKSYPANRAPTCYRLLLSEDGTTLAACCTDHESGQDDPNHGVRTDSQSDQEPKPENDARGDSQSARGDSQSARGDSQSARGDSQSALGCQGVSQTRREHPNNLNQEECPSSDDALLYIEVKELCSTLQSHIVENGFKPFAEGKSSLAAMERLLRIDHRTFDQVKYIIEWSQKDEFWLTNIRSPQKLRDKFDTLLGQSLKGKRGVLKFLSTDQEASSWDSLRSGNAGPAPEAETHIETTEEVQARNDELMAQLQADKKAAIDRAPKNVGVSS